MTPELKGKTAVVTGGTRGIGRAVAEALLREGMNVCVCARKAEEIERMVAELEDVGEGGVSGAACDVRDADEVRALFAHAASEFGGVDVLVNNAGIACAHRRGDFAEQFRAVIETTSRRLHCCREAIPMMRERGGGYIINMSSLAVPTRTRRWPPTTPRSSPNGFSEALCRKCATTASRSAT